MEVVQDVARAVEKFGGTAAMGRRFHVGPSAVSNWKKADRFPARLHYRIAKEAERDGFSVAEALFDPDDSRPCDTESPDEPAPAPEPPTQAAATDKREEAT